MRVLRQNLKIARAFVPMTTRELDRHRLRLEAFSADGRFELYKTTAEHDGETGRKQHGFPSSEELGG